MSRSLISCSRKFLKSKLTKKIYVPCDLVLDEDGTASSSDASDEGSKV